MRYHNSMAAYHHEEHSKHKSSGDDEKAKHHLDAKAKHEASAKKVQQSFIHAPAGAESGLNTSKPRMTSRSDNIRAARAGEMRQYYEVPFVRKEEARKLGMRWDAHHRSWYYPYVWGDVLPETSFKRKDNVHY